MNWTHPGYEAVATLLGKRTGLMFPPGRRDAAERGIRRAMERAHIGDPKRYHELIGRADNVFDDLVVELTIGETYFFREAAQFEFIRRQVLPEIRRRLGEEHQIRVWSAACASGEEAFSLAVLFEQEGLGERVHLLATDISSAALAKARKGQFSRWSLRGEGAKAVHPYLRQRGDIFILDETIHRRVKFDPLNLALDIYPSLVTGTGNMDLILCRNVLIYFDRETIRNVARRLFDSLAPGGWLITASSDPPLGDEAPFETVVTDVGVFYRRGHVNPHPVEWIAPPEATQRTSLSPGNEVEKSVATAAESQAISTKPSPSDQAEIAGPLIEAREAFSRGDYRRAAALTRDLAGDLAANVILLRALANIDVAEAERACAVATARHPLSRELHYLHSVLLLESGREREAAQAARRVIYLDRSSALAHFTLGSILRRLGDRAGARRAYRNARELCLAMPADQPVALGDGERAGRLAETARSELASLDSIPEDDS